MNYPQPAIIDFFSYPPIGPEDWRYAFATGKVRVLETQMPDRALLAELAGADRFEAAAEMLSGTEYSLSPKSDSGQIEAMLLERRSEVRRLFVDLMQDEAIVRMFRAREDFANMRLAVRRVVTDKPLGTDYSTEGAIPAEEFEEIFEQELYERFPDYLQEAVEAAVLGYYENKDIRTIDYAVDQAQFDALVDIARQAKCSYLEGLARVEADLTNIKAIMRKKLRDTDSAQGLINGGFVDADKLKAALLQPQEQFASICFATPYGSLIESGIDYLEKNNSFAGFEALCDKYLDSCYALASQITAGIQPIIAYYYLSLIHI